MTTRFSRRAMACALYTGTAFCGLTAQPAAAQQMPTMITPPEVATDPNELNLLTGKVMSQRPVLSIPAAPRLTFSRATDFHFHLKGERHSQTGSGKYAVHYGADRSESFDCESIECTSRNSNSGLQVSLSGTGSFAREKSGEVYQFGWQSQNWIDSDGVYHQESLGSSVSYPDGETLGLEYDMSGLLGPDPQFRLKKVSSNTGYFLGFEYWGALGTGPGAVIKTVGIYAQSAPTVALAKFTYSSDGKQVTDLAGRTWSCMWDCGYHTSIGPWQTTDSLTLPGETGTATSSSGVPGSGFVAGNITKDGVAWNYAYSGIASEYFIGTLKSYKYDSITATGPNGYSRTYQIQSLDHGTTVDGDPRYEVQYVKSSTNEIGQTTNFTYEPYNLSHRVIAITYPEGNSANFTYDLLGNITKRTDKAKGGSLPDIVQEAGFDPLTGCGGVKCWLPNWYKDALGRQTDFIYNGYGQLTQMTEPADVNGVRRRTIVEYAPAAGGISRREVVRVCGHHPTNSALTTCGTSVEERTEYDYFGDTNLPSAERRIGLVPDPANPSGPWISQTRETLYTYDSAGRLKTVNGPFPGTDDTQYFHYDVVGRKEWEIGGKPPSNPHLAKKFVYRAADDKVSAVEIGTVANPSAPSLSALERTDFTFDSRRNPIRETRSSGGTTYTVTDRSFLDRGPAECTTVRMNLAALPAATAAGACSLGTQGGDGPDRITKNFYNSRGLLTEIREALLTGDEGTEASFEYSFNDKRVSIIDGENNKTSFDYDGHDRLLKTRFPNPIKGHGGSNSTDYEQYGYDANGNRTSLRKRDGQTIGFTFDNLNRMTAKDLPGTAGDVGYTYDIFGRQLTATFSATGQGVTNVYNGFGEIVSSTSNVGGTARSLSHRYDLAGNRTRITHPDGKAFDMSYDALSRMSGATLTNASGTYGILAINFEPTGRRTNINRASSWTAYGYDGIGRLAWLPQIFVGSASNVTQTFTHTPASQIITAARDNDAYAWTGHGNGSTVTAVNGLNQIATKAGTAFAYDANGNLTGDGATTFAYDVENRLVSATGAKNATLTYDPMGRLSSLTSGGTTTRFLHDGDHLVAEYNDSTGAMTKRYMHGPGTDEIVLEDSGSALDCSGTKVLHPDHQGSIIAQGDCWGGRTAINKYDEYGNPQGGAITGRFGYTGQAWLPELGLYYYKARMYRPADGVFMQTDPIGYDDQYNLYAYVGADPVNMTDPSGTRIEIGGDEEYKKEVSGDIQKLMNGPSGKELTEKLESSTLKVEVLPVSESPDKDKFAGNHTSSTGTSGEPSGSKVYYDPSDRVGGKDVNGSSARPPFVGLAHEFGHAEDNLDGKPKLDRPDRTPGMTPPSEENAVKRENQIRSEHNLARRTTYWPPAGCRRTKNGCAP